jgi:hypothetical protein
MANTVHIASAVRDSMMNALAAAIDAGSAGATLEIRSGTQPANADATATGTVLATFTFADPFNDTGSSAGVLTIDAAPDLSTTASATGTATWGRIKDSSGNTILDGTVGTSGSTFNITSTSIVSGQTVTLTSGTFTLAA